MWTKCYCNMRIVPSFTGFSHRAKMEGKATESIHYVVCDLWMDQLLESVGMPVIDSAHADVTHHSSHTSFSLPLSLDMISM